MPDQPSGTCASRRDDVNEDLDVLVERAVEDLIVRYRGQHKVTTSILYSCVRGGHVQVVTRVLHVLRHRRLGNIIHWALDTKEIKPCVSSRHTCTQCVYYWQLVLRVVFMVLVAIVVVSISPVFYLIHGLCVKIGTENRRRISQKPQLPLVFAALSENQKMIELFTRMGVRLDHVDEHHNSVFHYLADLSAEDSAKAIRVFWVLKRSFPVADVSRALLEQENSDQMTPLDAIAKHGSLSLLKQVTEAEGLIRHTLLTNINQQSVHMDNTQSTGKIPYSLCHYDLTSYEQGDILSRQSRLLNLFTGRDFQSMKRQEVESFLACKALSSWSKLKVHSMNWTYYLSKTYAVLMYVTLCYFVLKLEGDNKTCPLIKPFASVYMDQIIHRIKEANALTFGKVMKDYGTAVRKYINGKHDEDSERIASKLIGQHCSKNVTLGDLNLVLNDCQTEALTSIQRACRGISRHRGLVNMCFIPDPGVDLAKHSARVLSFLLILEMVVDVLMRLAHLWHNYPFMQGSFFHALSCYLRAKFPGPYIERQLNVGYITSFIIFSALIENYQRPKDLDDLERKGNALTVHMMAGLIFHSLYVLYLFRLAPVLQLFFLTTIKLATCVFKFFVTYCIVAFGFTLIFFFVLKDPECPAQKPAGYGTIGSTFYHVYLAMLGLGDLPFSQSVLVKFIYLTYTLICAVLLLNLVIAIMASTAERAMRQPWRTVLLLMDTLEVALYAEIFQTVLLWPLRRLQKTRPGGFIYEHHKNSTKVYIEVEHVR